MRTVWLPGLLLFALDCGTAPIKPVHTIKVGKGPDALFVTANKKYLYVANVEDKYVSVVDLASNREVTRIDTADYPWGFSRLGKTNLVAISSWHKGVDLVDMRTHKVVRSARFKGNLGGLTTTADGKYIYVIASGENKVKQLAAKDLKQVKEFPVGKGADGVALGFADESLYVTNTKDKTISIIKLPDGTSKTVRLGGKPELIHGNKDHSLLFISNFYGNKVHVFDTKQHKPKLDIGGIDQPEEAVLSADERLLYIVSYKRRRVHVFDAATYTRTDVEYETGKNPIGVIEVGSKLYVSNFADNTVTAYKKRLPNE